MNKYSGNVLVLGQGDRAFLTVVRSLGRSGLDVHVAMCPPDDLALRSRYVARRHEVPPYRPDDDSWITAMETILSESPFQLVIPCIDQAVIPIQLHRDRLERLCRLSVLSDEAFKTSFSKIKSYELADRLGIPQPRSVVLKGSDSVESIRDLTLPVVVKPPSSFTADDLSAKRGVVRCRTREQLSEALKDLAGWGGAIAQENFIGVGVGVELLADGGKVLVAFQHVRVHEPLEGGGSSYRRSAELDPELLAASEAIMKELGYTGVAMVEFKFNFETGRWVFVETNGRFWGSLPLAIAAGVDFPTYLYEMLVHGRKEFPRRYRVPMFCRNLSTDQRWLRSNLTAKKDDPLLATRPLRSVAMEPVNLVMLRERWDTLTIDDPAPGLVDIAGIVGDAASKMACLCRAGFDNSSLVRRWRRWRALAKARDAKNILFVCKGNICRSPYAEHYARRRLSSEITVRSCGYYPVNGRPSPEVAQDVALEFGIDLSGHRSQIISEDQIREADLIFTFDEQNLDTVLRRFPSACDRVFGLGVFCRSHGYRVADPYGSEAARFRATYQQIMEAIENLSDQMNTESSTIVASRPESVEGSF